MSLTKDEIGIISRIEESVRNISEHVLPEIKVDVREARDLSKQAIHDIKQINLRVVSLEDASPVPVPVHVCDQVKTIAEIKTTLETSAGNRRYWIPIVATICLAFIGFLASAIRTESSTLQRISTIEKTQTEQSKNINEAISEMSKTSKRIEDINQTFYKRTYSQDIDDVFEDRIKNLSKTDQDLLRSVWDR